MPPAAYVGWGADRHCRASKDAFAPLSAIRGASVNRGGPTPEQPFGIIPNGASVAFTLIFLREASAPAFALARREGWPTRCHG